MTKVILVTVTMTLGVFMLSVLMVTQVNSTNWNTTAKQDIVAFKQAIMDNHPGVFNAEDPEFMMILNTGYEESLLAADQVYLKEDYLKVLRDYAHLFDDPHLGISPTDEFDVPASKISAGAACSSHFGIAELEPDMFWISLPTFEPNQEQQKNLESIIQRLPDLAQSKLIIFDLRDNGGGNSAWGNKIGEALFGKDYFRSLQRPASVWWQVSTGNIDFLQSYVTTFEKQFGIDSKEYEWAATTHYGMKKAQTAGHNFYVVERRSDANDFPIQNPVKAHLVAIIDEECASASLDFLDFLRVVEPPVLFVGRTTAADTIYMDVRSVILPSGYARLTFPMKMYTQRMRGNRQAYHPDIVYDGDMNNTQELQKFIFSLKARLVAPSL